MDLLESVQADHGALRRQLEALVHSDDHTRGLARYTALFVSHETAEALVLHPTVQRFIPEFEASNARGAASVDDVLDKCLAATAESSSAVPFLSELDRATSDHVRSQRVLVHRLVHVAPAATLRMLGERFARIRRATMSLEPLEEPDLAALVELTHRLAHRALLPAAEPRARLRITPCDVTAA